MQNQMLRPILPMLAVALSLTIPGVAFAHALLRSAEPAVGATVKTAPQNLTLNFTERLEAEFCRVEVTDAQGARVDQGRVQGDPSDGKRLIVPLKPLKPGVYTVIWHAVSVDTHKTEGRFRFTVAQ
ncbi:MAG: copper homeostasis periplasmic binding protein CopC [Acetobacteraceae bacterium]|nr:copper homeostasis periplasmic binding protein CopC [Acetobacteraceae bacterium]